MEFVPLEDKITTGNFEVTITDTGELIHSKKKLGMGKAVSTDEREAIIAKIRAVLDARDG